MKKLNYIEEACQIAANSNDASEKDLRENMIAIERFLRTFIAENARGVSAKSVSVKEFTGNEKIRPAMTGVYYDAEAKMAVATDGRKLFATAKEYNEDFAGKIIDVKTLKEIDGRFPSWKAVVPSEERLHDVNFRSKDSVLASIKAARADAKITRRKVKGNYSIELDAENHFWFALEHVELMVRYGLDGWQYAQRENGEIVEFYKSKGEGREKTIMLICLTTPNNRDNAKDGFCYIYGAPKY